MSSDPVAVRYAQTFFEVVQAEARVEESAASMQALRALITQHPAIQVVLVNPGVESAEKLRMLERLLGSGWSPDVRACVHMVLESGRADHLVEITAAFSELVDQARGVARVRVRTVHPLPDALKARLTQTLERREGRRVELVEEAAPELLGGLQVLLDHRMLDGSLRTQLDALKRRLKSVRVH